MTYPPKPKKIALINPGKTSLDHNSRAHEISNRNKNYFKMWHSAPLNLLVIAANTPKEFDIVLIDEEYDEINFDGAYDLVGITAMTHQAFRAYEIANAFRKKDVPVVMGGIHASVAPDEALQHVDTVFIGESEETWNLFLKDFISGKTKKVYENHVEFDLSKSKVPRYELINYEEFQKGDAFFKFLPVQATRGCPHDCSFCVTSKIYGKKIRKKTIEQVIEDIKYIQNLHYQSVIIFTDDNMFVDRKYAKALLKELTNLKIKYIAQTDIKVADDPELLRLAYLSGCLMMLIGFESIESGTLIGINENNWKMKQVQNYKEAIQKIQSNGILVFGAFVFGFSEDTLGTFENVSEFVDDNHIAAQFTLLTPLPGSRVYDQFKSEGRLIQETFWDKCSFFDMTFRHDKMSKEDAENKLIWLHDEVFKEENVMKRNKHMMEIYKKLPPRWEL